MLGFVLVLLFSGAAAGSDEAFVAETPLGATVVQRRPRPHAHARRLLLVNKDKKENFDKWFGLGAGDKSLHDYYNHMTRQQVKDDPTLTATSNWVLKAPGITKISY